MRRMGALQKVVVSRFSIPSLLIIVFLADALFGQTPTVAHLKTTQKENAGPANLTQRIERVESGLLPPAIVKGEPPLRMRLADRMQFYKTPAVSIAVINDGQIEWARGYGVLEAGGKDAVTSATLFQAASISKSLTAMLALRLVEQGKLDLDSDVNQRLVSWKIPENEFTKEQKVTLRRLLAHTAGVTVPGFLGYPVDETLPTLRQILKARSRLTRLPFASTRRPARNFVTPVVAM